MYSNFINFVEDVKNRSPVTLGSSDSGATFPLKLKVTLTLGEAEFCFSGSVARRDAPAPRSSPVPAAAAGHVPSLLFFPQQGSL